MTCIIGGDSAGAGGLNITIRKDSKVFRTGKFIIGHTSSFRMGQLLRFKLTVPEQPPEQDDYEFMCTHFIDAVRKCLKDGGYTTVKNETEEIGTFLVGYNGRLYEIDDDLQVGESCDNYGSVGCGSSYAKGALNMLHEMFNYSPEETIRKALATAGKFSGGVRPPFVILKG